MSSSARNLNKRDDATAGAESRKRSRAFLLADAVAKGRDTVLHVRRHPVEPRARDGNLLRAARAEVRALPARRQRSRRPGARRPRRGPPRRRERNPQSPRRGQIHLVTPAEYAQRVAILESEAQRIEREGGKPYVIPEGGLNGLGSLGYVEAIPM